MASHKSAGNSLANNFNVDYVISYRFATTGWSSLFGLAQPSSQLAEKEAAVISFQKLVQSLGEVGLDTEVRNGGNCSVLVFVKVASDERLARLVYRSRVRDWLYGVRQAQPDRETQKSLTLEPLTEAERFRIVYNMITGPRTEGGAGITPKEGDWKNVESIFLLHDHVYNKEWIKKWSTATFLKPEDIDQIRDRFGEKIGFYFAFTQCYFAFLTLPAVFGFSLWLLLGYFSPLYAIFNGLWCVIFVEYWKRQELDLAIKWGTKGVSAIQTKRRKFKHEQELQDPVTGEIVHIFPATKRLRRQLLQIPFAIVAAVALGTIIATCFGIEIFISEVYDGPLKSILVFLPTGILTTSVPTISALLTNFATKLTEYENYETTDGYESAFTQKVFVLNFITSYLPIFLTAFIYVPFASTIVPYLDIFSLTVKPFAENDKQLRAPKSGFQINPDRLRKQVIYFTVTAQIVNFAMETIVPYIKRKAFRKYQEMATERASRKGGATSDAATHDHSEEAAFLARVRNEAELSQYDVTDDLREMCIQFGYLSLFSVVWPLTAVSFFINNWIELRSDAVKICVEMQRPTPARAESIGPWLDSLGFLTWLGSITTAALVYLFRNDGVGPSGTPTNIQGWALLLTIFFSEHSYSLLKKTVAVAISKIDSPAQQKQRSEQFAVRKRYLEEVLEATVDVPPNQEKQERITRASLEEEAREGSLHNSTPSDRFWARQRGWEETADVGKGLIERLAPGTEAKKTR
ncbi:MAG: hypothetical protein M1834_001117 [Cirrosporium novae-zelandiae]|nr:MAG: hypothetical protein M1834_001117 [Cirrosporium novae-zelandiae]